MSVGWNVKEKVIDDICFVDVLTHRTFAIVS